VSRGPPGRRVEGLTLLEESYNYNGAKYGIDKDGDITITVETADTELTAKELQRYVRVLLQAAWLPH